MNHRLNHRFYSNPDVVVVARELLGKVIVTRTDNQITSGIICETEAYEGITDRASHAYAGRRTNRTQTMYLEGGHSYVYLCYGIHELFNVVTNHANEPHAVLIRGIIPLDGMEIIRHRRGVKIAESKLGIGPGNVSRCLGITRNFNGENLTVSDRLWIEDRNIAIPQDEILISPRIGVDYAGNDALLPYRFYFNPQILSAAHFRSSGFTA